MSNKVELTQEKVKEIAERIMEQIIAAVGEGHFAIGLVVYQLQNHVEIERKLEIFNKYGAGRIPPNQDQKEGQ